MGSTSLSLNISPNSIHMQIYSELAKYVLGECNTALILFFINISDRMFILIKSQYFVI